MMETCIINRTTIFYIFTLLTILIIKTNALNNGLALTPPMGWLAWERFQCNTNCQTDPENCISERLFMEMADRLVKDGFRDAGYRHINIDDCWMARHRSPDGRLLPDPKRFPRGIKFLADYMHARGLKLGIYQDFGTSTCMGYPGLVGHMDIDAATFAEWDVDMVKVDGCHSHPNDMDVGYTVFGQLLNRTGKPMIYSCSWPYYQLIKQMEPNYTKISQHCNLWRNYHDMKINWGNIVTVIDFFGDNQEVLNRHAGPGHWNDPDMIVVGNPGLAQEHAKVQMAMWAILAAPLLMSNDLRNLDDFSRSILLNPHVIRVDQDRLGIPGKRIFKKSRIEIWARPIEPVKHGYHSYALAFLNRQRKARPAVVRTTLEQLGLHYPMGYQVLDVYQNIKPKIVRPYDKFSLNIKPSTLIMIVATVIDDDTNNV